MAVRASPVGIHRLTFYFRVFDLKLFNSILEHPINLERSLEFFSTWRDPVIARRFRIQMGVAWRIQRRRSLRARGLLARSLCLKDSHGWLCMEDYSS
jgi:hypothetical protein